MNNSYRKFIKYSNNCVSSDAIVECGLPEEILLNESAFDSIYKFFHNIWKDFAKYAEKSISVRLIHNLLLTEPNSYYKKNIFGGYVDLYRDMKKMNISWKQLITVGLDAKLFLSVYTLYEMILPFINVEYAKSIFGNSEKIFIVSVVFTFFIALFSKPPKDYKDVMRKAEQKKKKDSEEDDDETKKRGRPRKKRGRPRKRKNQT